MIDLNPACRRTIALLAGVEDKQLTRSTPCADYSVGDLIDHIDLISQGAIALAHHAATLPEVIRPDIARLEPDWRGTTAQHLRALGEAWSTPTAWEGMGNVPGSELSNETWGKVTLTELVVHGWDIATATDQHFELPKPTVQACLDHVEQFVPNAPIPALWGPPVEVEPDAPLLVRILAITGRRP